MQQPAESEIFRPSSLQQSCNPDSAPDDAHHDEGSAKAMEREVRLRIARERQAEEKQRKLRELKEAAEKAEEFRRKQEEERRKKMDEARKREEVHRAIVEERRKKLLQEQNEKILAVVKKNAERKAKINDRKSKKQDESYLSLKLHQAGSYQALNESFQSSRQYLTAFRNVSAKRQLPVKRSPFASLSRNSQNTDGDNLPSYSVTDTHRSMEQPLTDFRLSSSSQSVNQLVFHQQKPIKMTAGDMKSLSRRNSFDGRLQERISSIANIDDDDDCINNYPISSEPDDIFCCLNDNRFDTMNVKSSGIMKAWEMNDASAFFGLSGEIRTIRPCFTGDHCGVERGALACLEGRAKACRSEDTLAGSASPVRSVPQRRRPHSVAGRCPSYAGHTVASQLRLGRGEEMCTSAVYCCSRFRSVSPTPPNSKKGRARSSDSARQSRIDHVQPMHVINRQSVTVAATRYVAQQTPAAASTLPAAAAASVAAAVRVQSSPVRPSQLAGVVPRAYVGGASGQPLSRTPSRPLRTPSPKTMSAPVHKSTTSKSSTGHKVMPSPQKPSTPAAKTSQNKTASDPVSTKPPPVVASQQKVSVSKDASPVVEKVVQLASVPAINKAEVGKDAEEDEYKQKLAEKRRQARELAERKAAEEKMLDEEKRKAEEERRLREEEEERRREEEELRLAEEAERMENERLRKAMEEEEQRRRREEERLESERLEKLAAEQKIKDESERREKERVEKAKRDEEDRAERKKKLELIMKRVKVEDNVTKGEMSPVSTNTGSANFEQQDGKVPASSGAFVRTSPPDEQADSPSSSFRSPLLQQMMETRSKCKSPPEPSKGEDLSMDILMKDNTTTAANMSLNENGISHVVKLANINNDELRHSIEHSSLDNECQAVPSPDATGEYLLETGSPTYFGGSVSSVVPVFTDTVQPDCRRDEFDDQHPNFSQSSTLDETAFNMCSGGISEVERADEMVEEQISCNVLEWIPKIDPLELVALPSDVCSGEISEVERADEMVEEQISCNVLERIPKIDPLELVALPSDVCSGEISEVERADEMVEEQISCNVLERIPKIDPLELVALPSDMSCNDQKSPSTEHFDHFNANNTLRDPEMQSLQQSLELDMNQLSNTLRGTQSPPQWLMKPDDQPQLCDVMVDNRDSVNGASDDKPAAVVKDLLIDSEDEEDDRTSVSNDKRELLSYVQPNDKVKQDKESIDDELIEATHDEVESPQSECIPDVVDCLSQSDNIAYPLPLDSRLYEHTDFVSAEGYNDNELAALSAGVTTEQDKILIPETDSTPQYCPSSSAAYATSSVSISDGHVETPAAWDITTCPRDFLAEKEMISQTADERDIHDAHLSSSDLGDIDGRAAAAVVPILQDCSSFSSDVQLIQMTEKAMPATNDTGCVEPMGIHQVVDENTFRVQPQKFPTNFTESKSGNSGKGQHASLVSPNEKSPLLTTDDHQMTYSSLTTNPDHVIKAASMREEEWQFPLMSEDEAAVEPLLQNLSPAGDAVLQKGEAQQFPGPLESTTGAEWPAFPTSMEESLTADRLLVDDDSSDCRSSFTVEDHMSYKSHDADHCSNSPDADLLDLEHVVLIDVNRGNSEEEERLDNRPLPPPFYSNPATADGWTGTAADVENNQVLISGMSDYLSGFSNANYLCENVAARTDPTEPVESIDQLLLQNTGAQRTATADHSQMSNADQLVDLDMSSASVPQVIFEDGTKVKRPSLSEMM